MKKFLFFLLAFSLLNITVFAEGTKEVSPSENNLTGLAVLTTTGAGSFLNCPEDNRIYFRIKDFNTEKFYFGVRPHYYNSLTGKPNSTWCADSIYVRIYNPSGAVVFQQKLDTSAGSAGFINTYAQAIAGPNVGGLATAGYNPLTVTPLMNGDYWMEFYYSQDGGATMVANATTTNTNGWLKFPYFDFTVATPTNTRFIGRVHSDKWNFVAITNAAAQANAGGFTSANRFEPNGNASSDAAYYTYSPDSVVMKIDFEPGFRPIAYNIAVNNYGVANTGNWLVDRRSVNSATAPSLANGYKIFLNDPDVTLYPSGYVPGNASFPEPTVRGCSPGPYKLRYKIQAPADVIILLDINGTPGYQPATTDRIIEQPGRPGGLNIYAWDGKDNLGNILPSGSVLNFSVSTYFQKGKASVPLYDAEINKNGFKMSGVRPVATAALRMYWDDSQLVNVGACGTTSANTSSQNNLTGAGINNSLFGTAAPSHAWNGTGNLSNVVPAPNAVYCSSTLVNDSIAATQYQFDDFGNVRVINTWAYGIENYISKQIKLLCVNVSGTVINDVDGSAGGTFGSIQNGSEVGSSGGTLYAAVVDPETNEVIAYAIVAANGTYTINGVPVNATGLQVIITSVLPVIDAPAPVGSAPAGWGTTSPNTATVNTLEVNIVNVNFGINQLPESAVNTQPALLNPGGTTAFIIPSTAFVTSTLATNPNTSDFGGGTVTNIRITAFPANATSITINGIKYGACATCTPWPTAGVVTPFTPGSGPTTPISVDPLDGIVNVVLPFVAIDNAGGEDLTPGSVTLIFTGTLNVKYTSFTANKMGNTSVLNFVIAEAVSGSIFTVERSDDGITFKSIGTILSNTNTSFNHTDFTPIPSTKNFYRIKELDAAGRVTYSEIRIVKFTKDSKIDVYPVPVRTNLNVVFGDDLLNKAVSILFFNTQGQLVFSKQINNAKSTETFSVDNLSAGVYHLRIVSNYAVVLDKKVIKIN